MRAALLLLAVALLVPVALPAASASTTVTPESTIKCIGELMERICNYADCVIHREFPCRL